MTDAGVQDWYRPGPKIAEFHRSKARIRALIGGRGCGKTTAIAVEACGHGLHNAGARIYILRKTQDSNEDTTLETFERQVFAQLGSAYVDTGQSLFKRIDGGRQFRIPSFRAVEAFNTWKQANPNAAKGQTCAWLDSIGERLCSRIIFAGVPTEGHRATRFRGFECSLLIFVEADQLLKEDLEMALACLRWKGVDPKTCDERGFIRDSGCILDTNPPSPSHWIAELEYDARDRGDKDVAFWHIPTEENRKNLPDGYIENLKRAWRKNPAMLKRMIEGEYADAFDGSPVLYQFCPDHVSETLEWPQGAYLIRGWDFGTTQAVVWSAYWADGPDEYWWDLLEYVAEQSDVERQCAAVTELTSKIFPFWNDRAVVSGVRDYCDPAGNAQKDTGRSIAVLNTWKFYPGFKKVGLPESLAVYNRLLERRDRFGAPSYRIDKHACPTLYTASLGGYRYPSKNEPGYGSDRPLKGEAGQSYDHVVDATRYAKIGCLRLITKEVDAASPMKGFWGRKVQANGPKKWY